MNEEYFRWRLAELRGQAGISARDLSLSLGQSESYINKIENGKAFPSMQMFFYICEYLGVTPSEFFDNANNFPSEYKEILEDLKALDAGQLHNIKAIIKDLRH